MPAFASRLGLPAFGLALLLVAPAAPRAATEPSLFVKDIQPLLATHCIRCHGPEKPKASLNLAAFTDEKSIQRQPKLWRRVLKQLETRAMPPEDEKQPSDAERQRLAGWVKQALAVTKPDPGPAIVRRLNRTQYERTIRDLIGIDFDSRDAVGMPSDSGGEGFDNLATGLDVSPALFEKYLAAVDRILERVLGMPDGSPSKDNFNRGQAKQAGDRLLFVKPGEQLSKRDAARLIIRSFARRAFRRPVSDAEIDRLLQLFDLADQRGDRFENGIRLMVKAVLASPRFLLRVEQDRADATGPYPISDHELAARLSYFLWSTMPDETLMQLADAGKLSYPDVLQQQVRRMLKDPKGRALTDNFGIQWLQLRKLNDARPSQEFFPTFTGGLRNAMREEVTIFFDKLREENHSVLDLLDADYTYVNEELARHYGIPDVKGGQMRRVALRPEDRRGGLLGMAGILTMTSHTSRTSPTLRGKWVLDVIFGTPPPPPPPDAGQLKEEKKDKTPKTFRELMAQHATQNTCAACHRKMDPLGYALDRFDAVGRWRTEEGLDTSGQLPTGEKFNGPQELKSILRQRQDAFVQNLTEQLLIYALGRELQPCDEDTVRAVTAALKDNDHRFGTLVLEVVKSYPFRHRRHRSVDDSD
jgi:mono/diheme cytochrome c family protein